MNTLAKIWAARRRSPFFHAMTIGDTVKMTKTRILLADDHTLIRAGIRALLEKQDDMEVVGEAADGHEAVQKVAELRRT